MRQEKPEEYLSGNLTAMIDVVFQLIIFFVCTISMQDATINSGIDLAMAPHGEAVTKKDQREILIDVDKAGDIRISRTRISPSVLLSVLKKAVAESGNQQIPIIIRGDANARHEGIKAVMDACASAGIYKIKFSALKEKAG